MNDALNKTVNITCIDQANSNNDVNTNTAPETINPNNMELDEDVTQNIISPNQITQNNFTNLMNQVKSSNINNFNM